MDSTAQGAFIEGVIYVLALGLLVSFLAWGAGVFVDLWTRITT